MTEGKTCDLPSLLKELSLSSLVRHRKAPGHLYLREFLFVWGTVTVWEMAKRARATIWRPNAACVHAWECWCGCECVSVQEGQRATVNSTFNEDTPLSTADAKKFFIV